MDWQKYPFLKLLIPFSLGIWCYVFLASFRLPPIWNFGLMAVFLGVAWICSATLKSFRKVWIFGGFMACYLFIAGYALTRTHEASEREDYFRRYEDGATCYVARVYDYPSERGNNIKAQLELQWQFGDSLSSRPVTGRVMGYFSKTEQALALRYGDLLVIPAPVGEVQPPKNPEEFDYRAYLLRKGVTGQAFLKEQDWVDLQTNQANPLYAFSYRFRDILLASLQKCGLKDNEFGVAAAILLGYDESLADEMRQHYVAAGSMHVLCVSGLHVGIVFLAASFLLGFLNRKRWHKILKNILLLAVIWFYALLAGLSPSILRATMMVSFVIVGDLIRRKGFALNSIAASAFILLCVNPYNLFEIGFQLSYSAVIGIVVLHKPIYHLFYLKNKLLDKIWDLTALAIAAQVATIPFTLFYFKQFTTYFWLSNLFMTPISFLVVMGGMALLMVSWIPYLNVAFGYLVWGMVYVMNTLVSWVDALPFSIVKGLYVSQFEFALLLLAFVLLLLTVTMRKKRLLFEWLAAMLVFMVVLTVRLYRADNQNEMVFFSLRKHTAVDFINGGNHLLLADSALMSDASTVDYSLKGFWARESLSCEPETVALDADFDGTFLRKRSNLVSFGGKLIALWDGSEIVEDSLLYRLPVDYLLVTMGNWSARKANLQAVLNEYEVKTLLIDGSVPNYLAREWMAQAQARNIACHDLHQAAFVLQLTEQ